MMIAFNPSEPDQTPDVAALWSACVEAVSEIYSLRAISYSEAIDVVAATMRGRVEPGCEQEMASIVLDKEFLKREGDNGALLTSHPIGELTPVETELCVRVMGLGAHLIHRTGFEAKGVVPAAPLLALCGTSRALAILSSIVELHDQGNHASVGILERSVIELWIYVVFLLNDGEAAVETLVSSHRWVFRDIDDDPILAILDIDPSKIPPRRPNLKAIADHVKSLDAPMGNLVQQTYSDLFGLASHFFTHTSLRGLLNHLEADKNYIRPTPVETGTDPFDQPSRPLMTAVLVGDMTRQHMKNIHNRELADWVRALDNFTVEVLKRRIDEAQRQNGP